jgi:hypothetical protein
MMGAVTIAPIPIGNITWIAKGLQVEPWRLLKDGWGARRRTSARRNMTPMMNGQ